jgi:hypothetical protein
MDFIDSFGHSISYFGSIGSYSTLIFFVICALLAPVLIKVSWFFIKIVSKIVFGLLIGFIAGSLVYALLVFILLPLLGTIIGWN